MNLGTVLPYSPRKQLTAKRALVIGGGGGGIGRATTEALGNEGASVLVADLDPARAALRVFLEQGTGGAIATAVANGGGSVRGPFG